MIEAEIRHMARLTRWSVVPVCRPQNLADHQYLVAIMCGRYIDINKMEGKEYVCQDYVCRDEQEISDVCSKKDVLWAALLHDLSELVSGDIPGPINSALKRRFPGFKQVVDGEVKRIFPWYNEDVSLLTKQIVAAMDAIEACCYLKEEIGFGNNSVIPHYEALVEKTSRFLFTIPWSNKVSFSLPEFMTSTIHNMDQPLKVIGEAGFFGNRDEFSLSKKS